MEACKDAVSPSARQRRRRSHETRVARKVQHHIYKNVSGSAIYDGENGVCTIDFRPLTFENYVYGTITMTHAKTIGLLGNIIRN